ncbi:hypothetical protein LSUE1_G005113, partial [Lachnellula suecica]
MSVLSVSLSTSHSFAKSPTAYIYLLANQVSLVDASLFAKLAKPSSQGLPSFQLSPGSLGENITTSGIDLGALAEGTRLCFG